MTTQPIRVPAGTPTGGQFAPTRRSESRLRLVKPGQEPITDESLARDWPNPYQRCDVLNSLLYDFASAAECRPDARLASCRDAVTRTFDVHGHFVSLPEDDGECESFVWEALSDDAKVQQAFERVVSPPLADYETRSFGSRLAGALYDIETAEREERLAAEGVAAARRDPNLGVWFSDDA